MRTDLPSGTVTFLFTDVEGSTKLLHEVGAEAYADVLTEHRRILREAFGAHGGVEVDTQGDAFFVAFPTATGALEAAAVALAVLALGPIRVRVGIHTGTPHLGEEGYVGTDVHRAARIAACGHGGQVLVSASTAALAGTEGLRELGEHRLKDLTAPERLYQLGGGDFPPLRTLYATNLPVAAGPLIGREAELADLASLLSDGTRVVTVTGPGGIGKTRFALQGAAELVDAFADGVFWVPLQSLAYALLVLPTVAQTVGARDDLAEFLGSRRTLILLDNLEHLLGAAPGIADLVSRCPDLRVLVTSRAPLRIAGEYELPLDPLPDQEASTLFVERARAAGRQIDPDETVAEICRRLDNLPLALELAATRTRLLTAPALLGRLERSLSVLTGGRRDAPERQQTLRATIEWSYELLDEEAQRLFARLSVFAGSFSLESAEAVCDADLEALAALVELSLLKPDGEDRLLMLETIREYAHERLEESSEAADVHARHADHFLELIPPPVAGPLLLDPPSKESIDRLEREYDNLRAAFDWLREIDDGERAIPAANSLYWTFLNVRGRSQEARPMLEAVLSIPGESDPGLRSAALVTLALVCGDLDDLEAARRFASEALELARSLDDSAHVQRALRTLARYQTNANEKRRMLLECEALAHKTEDEWSLAWVEMLLGHSAVEGGDYEEARRRFEQWLALAERSGVRSVVLQALVDLGCLAALDERFDDAREILARALHGSVELGATGFAAVCFDGLGAVAVGEGDAERATRLLAFAARFREENGEIIQRHQRLLDERTEAAARGQLGPRFGTEWDAGRALTLDEAAKLALGGR